MKKFLRQFKLGKTGDTKATLVDEELNRTRHSSKYLVDTNKQFVHRPHPPPPKPLEPKPESSVIVQAATGEQVQTSSGFDAWLSNCEPAPDPTNVFEVDGPPSLDERLLIEGFPEYDYLSLTISGVKKPQAQRRFVVTISGPWYMRLEDVNKILRRHGYVELVFARNVQSPDTWDGHRAFPDGPQVPVVDGPSCYDQVTGLVINRDETLAEFVKNLTALKVTCKEGKLTARSFLASLEIDFNRTLRLPEQAAIHAQPSGLGTIPVNTIEAIKSKLSGRGNESLTQMANKGGVFFPLYQREAMFMTFKATKGIFSVRPFVGGVNAVSGLPWNATHASRKQDYILAPLQSRLDGVSVGDGIVKQFVAMPLGSGYSVEQQVTGKETLGGLQLEITPSDLWQLYDYNSPLTIKDRQTCTPRKLGSTILELRPSDFHRELPLVTSGLQEEFDDSRSLHMVHLYLQQVKRNQNPHFGPPPFAVWRPGADVNMVAIYRFELTLTWYDRGPQTATVEWLPWWDLADCLNERNEAGFRIGGQSLFHYDLFLGSGPTASPLIMQYQLSIQQQGVQDGSILSARIKVGTCCIGIPPRRDSTPQLELPCHTQGNFPRPPMAAPPPIGQYNMSESSSMASVMLYASQGAVPSTMAPKAPSVSARMSHLSSQSTDAPISHPGEPIANLPIMGSSAYSGSPVQAVSNPSLTPYIVSPRLAAESPFVSNAVACGSSRPTSYASPGSTSRVSSPSSMITGSRLSLSSPITSTAPSSFESAGSVPAGPTKSHQAPSALQTKRDTGWAMGIAAGARIRQQILKDTYPTVKWATGQSTLLSVQILNSVAFEALTGMLTPPTPVTAETYLAQGLPFYESWGEAADTDGAETLSSIRSVGNIDAMAQINYGNSVARGTKVACTCCGRMMCDSILRPCNHSFCSSCIHGSMTYSGAVYCRLCGSKADHVLGISGPMALPGQDVVDLSSSKVITLRPFLGTAAFTPIYELSGMPDEHAGSKSYGPVELDACVPPDTYELA